MNVTINGYLIDAFLTEEHNFDSEVSEYPVESGSNITDNIRPKPITVTVSGIVSDTPLEPIATARGKQTSSTDDSDLEFLPSDDALAMLLKIRDAREPVPIETSLRRFENMALVTLSVPRDAETGAALAFTATFQQIRIITNNRTTIKVSPPAGTGLGPTKKKKKATTEWVDSKGGVMVWHHTDPKPLWSVTEVIGWNADDAKSGGVGFVHGPQAGSDAGKPLTQSEAHQMSSDNQLYSQTHDANGNETGHVVTGGSHAGEVQRELGPNEIQDQEGRRSTEPVFRQSDGTWVDEAGHPVVQDPSTGHWAETTEPPTAHVPTPDEVNGIPKSGG